MRHFRHAVAAVILLATPAVALAKPAAPSAALLAAIHDPARTARFVARDGARHPAQELAFFGLRPSAAVVEIDPGAGYWTEILAPYLKPHGIYYAALTTDAEEAKSVAAFRARLAADPMRYGHVQLTGMGPGAFTVAPPGTTDFVLTFRNLHNWMYAGYADQALAAFYTALRPGGLLGMEEHRGSPMVPQDPKAASGYVRQDYAIALAQKAGFELVASSEMLGNPKDTKNYPKGVWTLPPTYALGAQDRAKYTAIGEADNFLLLFRKPKS